ncbi:MAG: 8-amino-7-oxononanoate synthase, partial [Phototrophicales bacterium]
KGGIILLDKLCHASLIDGARLSGLRFQRYLHNDVSSLARYLKRYAGKPLLVVTDGVFSMDGDIAPLDEIAALCHKYGAMLMVDDAHGLGVLGERGRGSVNYFGLSQEQVPVLVGTFGKALGSSGAFISGPQLVMDYLLQNARPYIYTTAISPAIAHATCEAVKLLQGADKERSHLSSMIHLFKEQLSALGFTLLDSNT